MAELSLYTLSQEMKNYLLLSGGSVTGLLKLKDVKIDGRINYDDGNNIINYNLSTIEIGKNDVYLYCDNLIGASKDSNNTIQNWTINKNGQGTFKSLIIDDITDDEVNGNKAVNKNYVDNKIEDLNIDEGYSALIDLINQNKSETDNAIKNLTNNLNTEIRNRTYADDTIDSQIGLLEEGLSNEINRAEDAEESLQENINNLDDKLTLEITRAIESENTISERINSINELLIQKNDLLDEKIDDEITRATEAENNLEGQIDINTTAINDISSENCFRVFNTVPATDNDYIIFNITLPSNFKSGIIMLGFNRKQVNNELNKNIRIKVLPSGNDYFLTYPYTETESTSPTSVKGSDILKNYYANKFLLYLNSSTVVRPNCYLVNIF